ncbi:hypothetical protein J7L65_00645 [Candidatus Bathyarchaeota archaeon]|nr:hypothetical protein [Candidatus Bathyarchaeota archaeon]
MDRVMGWSLKPLSNSEIKAIHEASLTLLEEVGIKIPSEKALRLLEGGWGIHRLRGEGGQDIGEPRG